MSTMINKPISSEEAPQISGPFSPALKLGDSVYVSAQYPLGDHDDSLTHQTMLVIRNLVALLAELDLELRHVVKTTLYVTDLADLEEIDLIYATYFSHPYPARSVVCVSQLPYNSKVALDCVAMDTLMYEAQFNIKRYDSEDYPEHGCSDCHDGSCDDCM